jgi:hypothetical protein
MQVPAHLDGALIILRKPRADQVRLCAVAMLARGQQGALLARRARVQRSHAS